MPIQVELPLTYRSDKQLIVDLQSPTPVGQQPFEFTVQKRPGGTPFITKSCASGFSGVSGVTVLNSGTGQFQIDLWDDDMSGQVPANYWIEFRRTVSGRTTTCTEGWMVYHF